MTIPSILDSSGIAWSIIPWSAGPISYDVGVLYNDFTNNQTLAVFNASTVDVFSLSIWSKSEQFTFEYEPANSCKSNTVTGGPLEFSWLSASSYAGLQLVGVQLSQTWVMNTEFAQLTMWTDPQSGTPIRFAMAQESGNAHTMILDFFDFKAGQPPAPLFNIPSFCNIPSSSKPSEAVDKYARLVQATFSSKF
jgi:hypothetical protein